MEKYQTPESNIPDRETILSALKNPETRNSSKTIKDLGYFLLEEVKKAGLLDTPEGRAYYWFKESELYFEAGYKGLAMLTLDDAKKKVKGTKLEDYFNDISKDLKKDIDSM